MVDVGEKAVTGRKAVAGGRITMAPATLTRIVAGDHKKGDVLAVARIAAIMAAKRTGELIPLCHPLGLDSVAIDFAWESDALRVTATAAISAKTGIEMEAITASCVALMTIYDMAKAIDKGMVIDAVRLIAKDGGKSGRWRAAGFEDFEP